MGFRARLLSRGALQETSFRCTLMCHQPTVVHQRMPINTLGFAVVVKYDALIPVLLVALAAVVRPVLHERVLLAMRVVLRAMSREVQLHALAVIVVERVRVVLRATRFRRAQQAQIHGVLSGEVDVMAVIGVLPALDGGRGVGAVPLQSD